MIIILGIKLENRIENSENFQNILSKYGCSINTRIGFRGGNKGHCENFGIILLLMDESKDADNLASDLDMNIENIEILRMNFS